MVVELFETMIEGVFELRGFEGDTDLEKFVVAVNFADALIERVGETDADADVDTFIVAVSEMEFPSTDMRAV